MYFEIYGKLFSYSLCHFAMIIGLKCEGDASKKYAVTTERSEFVKAYFKQSARFKRETLESWFPDARMNNDEDAVKLALVYLVTSLPLNNNPIGSLPEFFINLVDNLESFNNFPSGQLVWEDIIGRIKKQTQNEVVKFECSVTNSHYNLFSFHLPLQVWLYEIFPIVTKNFANKVDEEAIPRMLGWVPSEQPTFARVNAVLRTPRIF